MCRVWGVGCRVYRVLGCFQRLLLRDYWSLGFALGFSRLVFRVQFVHNLGCLHCVYRAYCV